MSESNIDRIYRAMFVYTLGIHELMKNNITGEGINFGVISNFWKVYTLLLEYCCESDYKLVIGNSKLLLINSDQRK